MRALWLADVLRDAGLTVHDVGGWKSRGADSFGPVRGITIHHTAGSRNSTDEGEIRTLINGSTSAPPPIAQLYLSRSGAWHVVASGHCNHNKVGWGGPNSGYGNDALLGIEAQHSGGSEPWTDKQYRSYVRGVAALVRHKASGWDVSVARVAGHKEHQPGAKSDPTFNMDNFRARVAQEIKEWDMALEDADIEKIAERTADKVWKYNKLDNPYTTGPDTTSAGGYLRYAPSLPGIVSGVLAAIGQTDLVDEHLVVAGILEGIGPDVLGQALQRALTPELLREALTAAGWTPEQLSEIIPEAVADATVDRLAERIQRIQSN